MVIQVEWSNNGRNKAEQDKDLKMVAWTRSGECVGGGDAANKGQCKAEQEADKEAKEGGYR